MHKPEDMITVANASEALGVTPATVRSYITRGMLAGQKVGGCYQVDRSSVLELKATWKRWADRAVVNAMMAGAS